MSLIRAEAGAGNFSRLLWTLFPATSIEENRRKTEAKKITACLIPHLLVVITRPLEILVIAFVNTPLMYPAIFSLRGHSVDKVFSRLDFFLIMIMKKSSLKNTLSIKCSLREGNVSYLSHLYFYVKLPHAIPFCQTSNKVSTYKVVLCGKTGVGKTSIFRRMCGSDLDSPWKGCARNTLDPVECNVSVELEKETKIKVFLLLF